jgi:hypothetical protein
MCEMFAGRLLRAVQQRLTRFPIASGSKVIGRQKQDSGSQNRQWLEADSSDWRERPQRAARTPSRSMEG